MSCHCVVSHYVGQETLIRPTTKITAQMHSHKFEPDPNHIHFVTIFEISNSKTVDMLKFIVRSIYWADPNLLNDAKYKEIFLRG